MTIPKSIIFGATGAVGSAAARTAASLGAPVVLAMRDTAKPIPKLSSAALSSGQFERIRADLTSPDSITAAVKSTGATRAFVYAIRSSPDHMRSAMTALKTSGVSLVVFLSSFTVTGAGASPREVKPTEVIPFFHAQIEVVLEEVFGADGFVALRPGAFASNSLQYRQGISDGVVRTLGPKSHVDCIVPEDIGRVAGTVLVNGLPDDRATRLNLLGPAIMTKEESIGVIAKMLGKGEIKVTGPSKEDAYRYLVEESNMSDVFAKYMSEQSRKDEEQGSLGDEHVQVFGYKLHKLLLQNVEKYTGQKATKFEDWVWENRDRFE